MNWKPLRKRTLCNFLSLLIGLIGISLVTILLLYIYSLNYKPKHSDLGVGDIFGGIAFIFLGIILLGGFILIWTGRIIRDVIRFKTNRWFVIANLAFLLIPYGPFIGFGIYKSYLGVEFHSERKAILGDLIEYNSIELPNGSNIVAFENKNDSLYLFLKVQDVSVPKASYRRLTINSGSTLETQIWAHELRINYLTNTNISPIENFKLDTLSNPSGLRLNTHLPEKNCNIYHGDLGERKLTINNPCTPRVTTISGFSVYYRGNSPTNGFRFYVDSSDNYWFLFYTEERPNDIKNLFVGMVDTTQTVVYQIPLEDRDKKEFDSDNIITMYRMGSKIYIISKHRILYFEVPKFK